MRGAFSKWHSGVVTAFALVIAAPAWAQTVSPPPSPPLKWAPFIDLDGKAGTSRNIGEGDLFIPLLQNGDSMLFADLRGRFDDRSNDEGNFGLGFRHMLPSGWNLGAYGYYDRRSTALGSIFEQATFGAEALSLDWDLRANLYQPIGPRVRNLSTSASTATASTSSSTAALAGTAIDVTTATTTTSTTVTTTAQEIEQQGFDGEIGWRVPVFAPEALTQLRVYAGGYRFTGNGVGPTEGPRGRLDLTIDQVPYLWNGARLDIGGEIQHDTPRGTQAFAEISLRIPLQVFGASAPPAALTAMDRRMEDPIERDVDIVSQSHNASATTTTVANSTLVEAATATAGGSAITVLSSASTPGTSLATAITNAGANSTVILTGSFNTGGGLITLNSGQTVFGGGGGLAVTTATGHTATLTAPMATITGNVGSTNSTVTMANNSTLKGLTINNTDTTNNNAIAVTANAVSGATIANNTLNATQTGVAGTAHGVDVVSGSSNITVSGNTITATGGSIDIGVEVNASSATVTGNNLSASGASSTNAAVSLITANILSGSSGNTAAAGICNVPVAGTGGTVTFTNAAPCGP